ncbi:uncharacterized protein [Leptinotarsa decemlineata]|uniref:uncharacterized protein n=1 Tax=Leptinotarsa decemlineata TaxID=7539 RepID=UPI003D30A634
MGNAHLTFEELYSLLTQIEAIVNSRPLTPLSTHPSDPLPLTPAHFLVGRSLIGVPDADLRTVPQNKLSSYERMQQITQHFWERWSKEFISEVQHRLKWKTSQQQLKTGTIVLIKEENQPPMVWKLGRIEAVHPGKDGINRVATILTSTGMVKRSFNRICPLPIEEIESQSFQGGGHVQAFTLYSHSPPGCQTQP